MVNYINNNIWVKFYKVYYEISDQKKTLVN